MAAACEISELASQAGPRTRSCVVVLCRCACARFVSRAALLQRLVSRRHSHRAQRAARVRGQVQGYLQFCTIALRCRIPHLPATPPARRQLLRCCRQCSQTSRQAFRKRAFVRLIIVLTMHAFLLRTARRHRAPADHACNDWPIRYQSSQGRHLESDFEGSRDTAGGRAGSHTL